MSTDLYNLIYHKLEGYRGQDYYEHRAKIAIELHDVIASLLTSQCPEGGCIAEVFLVEGRDRPVIEHCNAISPRRQLKCELPAGHLNWKNNEGYYHRNGYTVWRLEGT